MRTRTIAAAAVFYVALTLVLTYPFSTQLTTHVLSGGTDMDLAVWTIGWDVHAFTHHPWAIFDANIFFPFHNTLAYSENLIGSAMLAAPVIWLTGNTILGMNLVALFAIAMSAFGAFLLARRLGLSIAASLIAGIIFGFAPPRFFRADQLPISTVQWIPFTLLALHCYFDTGRSRYLKIAVALYSLQALTSGHGTAMLTLAVAMLLLWKLLHGEPIAIGRRLRDIGWQGALALVPAALIYWPYRLAQREVGLKRALESWTLSTPSYFTSPTLADQWLRGRMPDWAWLKGDADAWLFPGVLPIVLAIVAIAMSLRSRPKDTRDHLWLYASLALLTLWMAIGPPFGIWRVMYWMPGLNFVRIPSRFTVVGMLALGLVAASGFDRLTAALRPAMRTAAGVLCAGALIGEFALWPMPSEPFALNIPAIDRWVGTQPQSMALLEMPMSDSRVDSRREKWTTEFMLHSMAHWKPLFVGYSGIKPPAYQENYATLVSFPDEPSLALARRLGITHVILHGELVDPTERTLVEEKYARFANQVQLVHTEGDGRLYVIKP